MSKPERIVFNRDTTQVVGLKKNDRILISGPCEIEITEIKDTASLDYRIEVLLSMPRENRFVKIKPSQLHYEGANFETNSKIRQ